MLVARLPRIGLLLVLLLAGVLTACEEQSLYTGLTEQEANEMVALMQRAGLPGSKNVSKDQTFAVATEEDHFADAVQLLQANGLPREKFDTLADIFKDDGFVSNGTSQHARLMHALSQEISHTLSSIDGVILARVHLAMPERDPLSELQPSSSASVFIKHRTDVDLSSQVSQIKAIVINGFENLPYENVTVALFEAMPQSAYHPAPKAAAPAPRTTIDDNTVSFSEPAVASKMSFLPNTSPLSLILIGLVLIVFVIVGLLWSLWVRTKAIAAGTAHAAQTTQS